MRRGPASCSLRPASRPTSRASSTSKETGSGSSRAGPPPGSSITSTSSAAAARGRTCSPASTSSTVSPLSPRTSCRATSWSGAIRRASGSRSLVFLASYSGSTEDTLAALRHANAVGAHTVAIAKRRPSPMASEAAEVIDYDSTALYLLPLAAVTLFALELAREVAGPRREEAEAALAGLAELPGILGRAYREGEAAALEQARRFLSSTALTVLAAGPLYGLGYKFALTVFMENIRVIGSIIEAAEFRHGRVEALERSRLDIVALLGTDATRCDPALGRDRRGERGPRPDDRCRRLPRPPPPPRTVRPPRAAPVVHGLFGPPARHHRLDERVFMGHRVLATGPDATWPCRPVAAPSPRHLERSHHHRDGHRRPPPQAPPDGASCRPRRRARPSGRHRGAGGASSPPAWGTSS